MSQPTQDARGAERGHLMAGVLVLVALMLIFSTVIFQSWEHAMQRDNEAEMIFRAQDYARALLRYRKAYAHLPFVLDNLIEPGPKGQYFLRRLYKDPLVRDGRWGLLYSGPNGEIIDPNGMASAGVAGGLTEERMTEVLNAPSTPGTGDPRRQQWGGEALPESEVAGGRQFTGLQIAGVKSLSTEDPFRIWQGHEDYSAWRFTYLDLLAPKVPGQVQKPPKSGAGTPAGGLPPFGEGKGKGKGKDKK